MNISNVYSPLVEFSLSGLGAKSAGRLFGIKLVAFPWNFILSSNDVTGNCLECTCLFRCCNVRDCFVLLRFVLVTFSLLFTSVHGIILREAFVDETLAWGVEVKGGERGRGWVSVALIVSKQSTREREILFNCVRRIPGTR